MSERKPYKVGDKTIIEGYTNEDDQTAALKEGQVVMLDDDEYKIHQEHGVILVPMPPAGNVADNDEHFDAFAVHSADLAREEDVDIDHDEEGSSPDDPDEF